LAPRSWQVSTSRTTAAETSKRRGGGDFERGGMFRAAFFLEDGTEPRIPMIGRLSRRESMSDGIKTGHMGKRGR